MLKRVATAVAIPLVMIACSSGPPPEPPGPPPLDPTGTFDITINAEGQSINGVLVIESSADGSYTGSIDTPMGGASVADITVSDQTLFFVISEIEGSIEVTFEGDNFEGVISSAMFAADLYGTRRPGD